MSSGLRKVVHVEVFDFDSDTMAYAVNTHKNQFGYKYTTQYLSRGRVVKTDPEVNNVERGAFYYNKFKINMDQMKSLRRFIRRIKGSNNLIPFPMEDGRIEAVIRGGTKITYRGEHHEEFYQKILKF